MTDVKWYRVIDPLSPLYGCDLRLAPGRLNLRLSAGGVKTFATIEALRRIDVFVGDRPFQLISPEHETLGLMIDAAQLENSPIQDDIVELATDRPYGNFLEENQIFRGEGECLHLVAYDDAFQVALRSSDRVITTRITTGETELIDGIRLAFERNRPTEEVKMMIERLP